MKTTLDLNYSAKQIVEVIFGAVAAINIITFRLSPAEALFSQWAALVGCAYVIARGLNNYSAAKQKALITVASQAV